MNEQPPLAEGTRPAWGCLDVKEIGAAAAGQAVEPGVREHLSRCAECRREVQGLQRELRRPGARSAAPDGRPTRVGRVFLYLLLGMGLVAAAIWVLSRPRERPDPVTPERVVVPAEPPPVRRTRPRRSGPSNHSAIVATIRQNQAGVRICYERALKRDVGLKVRLDVQVNVSATGAVEQVSIDGPRGVSELTSCVRNMIKTWQFPREPKGYASSFPLLLHPSP